MNRARHWLAQARRDLEHARQSIGLGHFEWACFAAQQAAEKAAKALHLYLGTDTWGDSVFELLGGLPPDRRPPDALLDQARMLDRFYIPPRYPNAHPSGPPSQFYTRADAEQGVASAEAVVSHCERQVLPAGSSAS